MRASVITALAALGLAGVLFAPMTANATSIVSAGANEYGTGTDEGGWKWVKSFESLEKCTEAADKFEDEHKGDTLCAPDDKGEKWDLWVQEHGSQGLLR